MEQQFKKLEDFEFDFNPDHLELMNQRLDAEFGPVSKPSVWKSVWFKGAAAVAVVTGIAVSAYFLTKDNNTSSQLSNSDVQQSEEIVDNNIAPVENNNIEPAVVNDNNDEGTSNDVKEESDNKDVDQDNRQENNEKPVDQNTPVKQEADDSQTNQQQNNPTPAAPKVIKANTTFKVSKRSACPGDAIAFNIENPTKGFSYHWEFSDGGVKVGTSIKHAFEVAGKYDVNIVAINNKDQDNISRIKHDELIKVHGIGNAVILVNDDDLSIKDPYTQFSLSEGFEGNVAWSFGNGLKGSGNSAEVYFESKGSHKVTALLTTKEGCKTKLQKEHFNNYEVDLFAPNALRPVAGNTEKGRTFIPGALRTGEVMFTMTIKDQSGQTVYSTTSADEPWNGKLNNNGELLPEGMYAWTVVYKDKNGQPFTKRGTVRLLRN